MSYVAPSTQPPKAMLAASQQECRGLWPHRGRSQPHSCRRSEQGAVEEGPPHARGASRHNGGPARRPRRPCWRWATSIHACWRPWLRPTPPLMEEAGRRDCETARKRVRVPMPLRFATGRRAALPVGRSPSLAGSSPRARCRAADQCRCVPPAGRARLRKTGCKHGRCTAPAGRYPMRLRWFVCGQSCCDAGLGGARQDRIRFRLYLGSGSSHAAPFTKLRRPALSAHASVSQPSALNSTILLWMLPAPDSGRGGGSQPGGRRAN